MYLIDCYKMLLAYQDHRRTRTSVIIVPRLVSDRETHVGETQVAVSYRPGITHHLIGPVSLGWWLTLGEHRDMKFF